MALRREDAQSVLKLWPYEAKLVIVLKHGLAPRSGTRCPKIMALCGEVVQSVLKSTLYAAKLAIVS